MTLYEYTCLNCDIDYEKERSMLDDEPSYYCEDCGYALIRVYNPTTTIFKGGGFYKTDNR